MSNNYVQKEIQFADIEEIKEEPKAKEIKLSSFNDKLKTALNYNPKEVKEKPDNDIAPELF